MGQAISAARLEDRYFLQKVKLGQGSFGTVWRAVDRQSNDVVAIKQLDKAMLPKRGVRRQDIEREVTVMQAVHHENVTRLLDFFEDQAAIYMALEYCDGGDFGDKVKERGQNLQELEAAEWMRQISAAIGALHCQAICHRDIKPDNFMVHMESLKLADFGLALFLPRGRLLVEKCGTPAFMSPEQHKLPRQSRGYSNPCDMWAAGVCMYMMMNGGRHPFLAAGGQQLDQRRLIEGTLDFSEGGGFFGFGGSSASSSRFPEAARDLCRRMVEPLPDRRISAADASRDPWLSANGAGRRSTAPAAAPASASPKHAVSPTRASGTSPVSPMRGLAAQADAGLSQAFAGVTAGFDSWFGGGSPKPEVDLQKQVRENLESQMEIMQNMNNATVKMSRKSTLSAGSPVFNGEVFPLQPGTKCRYHSSSWDGWMPAVVMCFNRGDGTYDLDVRLHARPENISPAADVSEAEAWPPGSFVYYDSASVGSFLPAVVHSFNMRSRIAEASYNLDVRDLASVDRIRPRVK